MVTDLPKVSIILVNYNGSLDTKECLESLNGITYNNIEIIVVDNKSTDDSVIILKEYQKKQSFYLIEADENKGFSAGNNLGIKYAIQNGTDYVLLLNNDTIVTPDFLTFLLQNVKDDNVIATGTILFHTNKEKVWYGGGKIGLFTGRVQHFYYEKDKSNLPKEPMEVNFISGCETLIPKAAFEKVGYLDEVYFLYEEDSDYCIRLKRNGYKLLYVPQSVIYHKVNGSTAKIQDKTYYYLARNKRILIYKYFKWYQIITALMFTNIQALYRWMRGRQSIKSFFAGIRDYYKKSY